MRERLLVIHNRKAGLHRAQYEATLSLLRSEGCAVDVVEPESADDTRLTAKRAAKLENLDAIVAAGGDGTVHDVAEGLFGYSTPLGIIPAGTSDVYARELGLPRAPDQLAKILLEGPTRTLPVGEVNGRIFLFVVGAGLDADAVRIFEESGARALARFGIVLPALSAAFRFKEGHLSVSTDTGASVAKWVIVTRASRYAAGLLLTPDASLDKPQLHVLRMGGGHLARVGQLAAMAIGALRFAPGVTTESTQALRIEGDRETAVQIDGEARGVLPLNIRIHPKRLNVVLPR